MVEIHLSCVCVCAKDWTLYDSWLLLQTGEPYIFLLEHTQTAESRKFSDLVSALFRFGLSFHSRANGIFVPYFFLFFLLIRSDENHSFYCSQLKYTQPKKNHPCQMWIGYETEIFVLLSLSHRILFFFLLLLSFIAREIFFIFSRPYWACARDSTHTYNNTQNKSSFEIPIFLN